MSEQLTALTLIVNNDVVPYKSGTLKYKDGAATSVVTNMVVGAEATEQNYAIDLSSKFGEVSFEMPTTVETEELKTAWKANRNNNVVELVGPKGTTFAKIFTQASISNDPEVVIDTDGSIPIEFQSNPAQ